MHVPEWLVTPFDVKIYNKGHVSDFEDKLIQMNVNLGIKAMLKRKTPENIGAVSILLVSTQSSQPSFEPFLPAFATSYIVEAVNHVSANLTKQRNRLNLQNRRDLPLKLKIFNRISTILLLLMKHIHPISANYYTKKVC